MEQSKAKDPRTALKELEQAAEAAPQDGDVRCDLGQALLANGDMAGAEKAFLKALDLGTGKAAVALTQLAGLAAMQGDLERSEERLQRALAEDEAYAPAWANLGFLHLQRNNAEQGVEALQRAASLDPSPPVLSRLAVACMAAGDLDGCEQAALKTLDQDPDFGPALDTLAVAAYRRGNFSLAREYQDKAVKKGFPPNEALTAALEREQGQG